MHRAVEHLFWRCYPPCPFARQHVEVRCWTRNQDVVSQVTRPFVEELLPPSPRPVDAQGHQRGRGHHRVNPKQVHSCPVSALGLQGAEALGSTENGLNPTLLRGDLVTDVEGIFNRDVLEERMGQDGVASGGDLGIVIHVVGWGRDALRRSCRSHSRSVNLSLQFLAGPFFVRCPLGLGSFQLCSFFAERLRPWLPAPLCLAHREGSFFGVLAGLGAFLLLHIVEPPLAGITGHDNDR